MMQRETPCCTKSQKANYIGKDLNQHPSGFNTSKKIGEHPFIMEKTHKPTPKTPN